MCLRCIHTPLKPELCDSQSITALICFKSVASLRFPSHHSTARLSKQNFLISCILKPHDEFYRINRVIRMNATRAVRLFYVLLFLFVGSRSFSQEYSLRDTFKIYMAQKPSLYFSFDGRNSFVRDQPAIIDGLRMGLSFGGKIRLLAGMYILRNPIVREYIYAPFTPRMEYRKQTNDFRYVSLTCDYVLYNQNRWKLSLPVQLGYGFGSRVERNVSGTVREQHSFPFVPLEAAFSASFKPLPWFFLSAGLGYRYALFSSKVSYDFSAPIYSYGLGIDVDYFWTRYRNLVF